MARFALVAIICATALCVGNIGVHAEDIEEGLVQATKALKGACWYEYLKIKPDSNPRAPKFGNCYLNVDLKKTSDTWKSKGYGFDVIKNSMGSKASSIKMYAPAQYSECSDYLSDSEKKFSQDYSAILGDGSGDYPYKGLAHCVVGQMEKTHGQKALDAMKEKWGSPSHPWMNEVHNRENENRARHGAPPTTINKELNRRAQKWATQLVERCPDVLQLSDHISNDHPDAKYEGQQTGESIAQGSSVMTPEDNAMVAANGWYEEVSNYPWPSYNGDGNDPVFYSIGHFSASVWKGTQQVGYGLGKREGCDKVYVVSRYWPAGNMPGKFADNIGALSD